MKFATFRRLVQFFWLFLFSTPVIMGATFVLGTLLSARIFGIALTDPLVGIEIISATKKIYLPLIISILLVAIPYAAIGRAYCGWVCPVNTLLDFTDRLIVVLGVGKFLPTPKKNSLRL